MRTKSDFTSAQSKFQAAAAVIYLPFHLLFIPLLFSRLLPDNCDMAIFNFICYATGMVFMLITQWSFLREDYDALCDNLPGIIFEIIISYALMMCLNLIVNSILMMIVPLDISPNNDAVMELASENTNITAAAVIFLAPIVEELIFRAGIFGFMRRYNRTLAYILSVLLFSLYHVWGYALEDASNWIYILQYIPVSFLLCRCYERSNSIWGSIFFHMLINFISFRLLDVLYSML